MSREQTYKAIIIKKLAFGEADEIITFFTEETGKIRALAKSVKLGKSKLAGALQPIFINEVTLAGQGNLPKVISVQTLETFQNLQSDPERVSVWFVIAELLNKSLPDEQKNAELFKYLFEYLGFLNSDNFDKDKLLPSLVKFKIHFLQLIGLGIHGPILSAGPEENVGFSLESGGFYKAPQVLAPKPKAGQAWQAFKQVEAVSFFEIEKYYPGMDELSDLVNRFITYQLEREIKSDRFLKG